MPQPTVGHLRFPWKDITAWKFAEARSRRFFLQQGIARFATMDSRNEAG
jgi:hypothetical protein